jgi:hypothetical protein
VAWLVLSVSENGKIVVAIAVFEKAIASPPLTTKKMEIIAYCNNQCCPSIVFNEKDRSQPVLIKDDYQGSIPLTLRQFEHLSSKISIIKNSAVYPVQISDREFVILAYETDKPYISIQRVDTTGNTRKVRNITFDHWAVFTEAIAENYVTA